MRNRKALILGMFALAILGLVTAALVSSPVGAATTVTKKKAKTIAKKQVNKVAPGIVNTLTPAIAQSFDPVVSADVDTDAGGTTSTGAVTDLNTLTITAPAAGYLVIEGSVALANLETLSVPKNLDVALDGATLAGAGGEATIGENSSIGAEPAEELTVAHTYVAAVTAGAHTVKQTITPGGTASYIYNRNNLVATWYPTNKVAVA